MSKVFFTGFFLLLVLLLVSGNVDLNHLSKAELTELVEDILKKTKQANTKTEKLVLATQRVEVFTQLEEVPASQDRQSHLFCNYTLSTTEDLPVDVTWKVGDGPRYASTILKCDGYTRSSHACKSIEIVDSNYSDRLGLGKILPSLEFSKVVSSDSRNYWCEIALVNPTNFEQEFDMKSIVMRVNDDASSPLPKFHSVSIGDDVELSVGENATLNCACKGNGYHCDDVNWYKGPADGDDSNYRLVYTRTTHYKPTPTEYQAHNEWIGRATLVGDSLIIQNVQADDTGRYWCEIKSASYKAIGEWGTDAKSMLLVVDTGSDLDKEFDCNGMPDGAYPDENDCNKYYECVNNALHKRQCPETLVFYKDENTIANYCNYPQDVPPPCGTKKENELKK